MMLKSWSLCLKISVINSEIHSTTMKERINFHALWCSIRDAWRDGYDTSTNKGSRTPRQLLPLFIEGRAVIANELSSIPFGHINF